LSTSSVISHSKRYLSALPVNLEKELDRLYGLSRESFTAARDTRARELRSAGEREAAERLKKARKPTSTAWAANQLARSERMNVRALLTAGEQLRQAQAEVMRGGKPDGLRQAQRGERRALAALLEAARPVVASDAVLRRLEETLRAAALDPQARGILERGRLTSDLAPSGFGLDGMSAPKKRKRETSRKQPSDGADRRRARLAEGRAELQEAKKRARAAEREAEKARGEVERIEEQVRALQRFTK
jgi:hypothetical protein